MGEWITDAAIAALGVALVVLILRITARPARTEKVASIVRHRIELREHLVSLVGEDEAYRLLRAVSARLARPQSDVIVLNKCIELGKANQAARSAEANRQHPGELARIK